MAVFKNFPVALIILSLFLIQGCNKALVVKNVNYAQQIESVLTPDTEGIVTDIRHGISYSVMPFQYEEFQDSSKVLINEVRMIRNHQGYYFITADKFKHVWVMSPEKGALKVKKKILINEEGISSPAFNWRSPNVQLLSEIEDESTLLNENGITDTQEEQS